MPTGREQKTIFYNIDWIIILLYLILVLMGWFNIYAAVYDEQHQSIFDLSRNYGKQLIWIITSFFLAALILAVDAKFYSTFSYFIYVLMLLILVAVLLTGKEIKDTRAWFELGSFRIQPAEFAKFAANMALAKYLSTLDIKIEHFKTKVISIFLIGLPVGLILLQNDTGSALVFGAFIFVLYREGMSGSVLLTGALVALLFVLTMMINKFTLLIVLACIAAVLTWIGRRKRKYIFIVLAGLFFSSGIIFSVDYVFEHVLEPHQKQRINVLLKKENDLKGAGYNVNQSLIAIGSGGLTGKGFLHGTQTKYDFVPEQSTDFIFCTVGEEWGFAGSFVVIGLFIFLLFRIIMMAERQRAVYSRIYGYGVASILFIHIFINIGMTIGLLPVIGIPLPFFSYGGSSLWSFTILLFIFVKLDASRLLILR